MNKRLLKDLNLGEKILACKINEFIYSQIEKTFCNLIMYIGNIDTVKTKLEEELAKRNYNLID